MAVSAVLRVTGLSPATQKENLSALLGFLGPVKRLDLLLEQTYAPVAVQ